MNGGERKAHQFTGYGPGLHTRHAIEQNVKMNVRSCRVSMRTAGTGTQHRAIVLPATQSRNSVLVRKRSIRKLGWYSFILKLNPTKISPTTNAAYTITRHSSRTLYTRIFQEGSKVILPTRNSQNHIWLRCFTFLSLCFHVNTRIGSLQTSPRDEGRTCNEENGSPVSTVAAMRRKSDSATPTKEREQGIHTCTSRASQRRV